MKDALEDFFGKVGRQGRLTPDEEKELAYRMQEGDVEARDEFIRKNLKLVISIAKKYAGRGMPLDDLIEEGVLGAIHAVEMFDPEFNCHFSTYAYRAVVRAIRKAIETKTHIIHLPAHTQNKNGKEKLRNLAERARHIEGDKELGYIVEREDEQPIDTTPLLAALDKITDPRAKQIIIERYGLDGKGERTLKEVGEHCDPPVTKERSRQIIRDTLLSLREMLEAQ